MTDTDDCVLFSVSEGLARITLNRPEQLNAISRGVHRRLREILDELEARGDIRVMLLTGAGRAFCAGQDLGERRVEEGAPPPDLGTSVGTLYNPLVRRLAALPFPWVCAVNGVAAGAGANLALLADVVIAKDSARFIQSFARIGLMPDCGGSWTLPRLIGQARALGVALTGEPVSARDAEAWGMIWKAVPDDDFAAYVEQFVAGLAQAPTLGLTATRDAIRTAGSRTLDEQLELERDGQRRLGLSDDYREGVSAFKAKRPPRFAGR